MRPHTLRSLPLSALPPSSPLRFHSIFCSVSFSNLCVHLSLSFGSRVTNHSQRLTEWTTAEIIRRWSSQTADIQHQQNGCERAWNSELRTEGGSKIQEWRLHACANCGEIPHLLDHSLDTQIGKLGALRQGVQIHHRGITESATFRETKMSCGTSTRRTGVMTPSGNAPEPRMHQTRTSDQY